MSKLKELREKHADAITKAQAILDVAGSREGGVTDKDRSEYDAVIAESDILAADIKRYEAIEARQKDLVLAAHDRAKPFANGNGSPRVEYVPQRHGQLNGFMNVEDAYKAGASIAASLGHENATNFCKNQGVRFSSVQNAMSAGSNADGGLLVPEQMETAITRLVKDYGVFRRMARNFPMSSETAIIPKRTAGVTAYWTSDVPSSATTESSPKVGANTLTAKPLSARTLISKFLQEDAFADLASFVAMEVAMEFARQEDEAGFNGDGTSTYGGITGLKNALAAGSKYTALAGNISFETLDLVDFEAMVAKLPTYALSGARWFISRPGAWLSMFRLQDAAGGNQNTQLAEGPRQMFLGFPVEYVEVMNATSGSQTSTDGLCYFGNLPQTAVFGNRRGIIGQVLNELYAATFQIGLLYTQRLDIVVTEPGTASVAGSMIMLSTPGA